MTEWTDFYDGALHADKSDPRDHDDIHPVAWRERQDRRRVSSGDAPPPVVAWRDRFAGQPPMGQCPNCGWLAEHHPECDDRWPQGGDTDDTH